MLQGFSQLNSPIARYLTPSALIRAVAVLLGVALLAGSGTAFFSQDATQMLSTADELSDHFALRTATPFFESQLALGSPAPQTVWPPLFPLVVALTSGALGLDQVTGMALVNALAVAATIILLFWILRRLLGSDWAAAGWAAFYGVYWQTWTPALTGGSEPLFALLLTAGLAAVVAAETLPEGAAKPAGRLRWLIAAGALFGLAAATRYLGVTFAAALCLGLVVLEARRGSVLRGVGLAVAAGLPAAAILGPLLLRNLLLTGTLTGGPAAVEGGGLLDIAQQTRWALGAMLGTRGLTGWALAFLLAAGGGASIYFAARARLAGRGAAADGEARALIAAAAGGGLALTVLLVYALAFRSTAYLIEARYFSVLSPALIVFIAALWPRGASRSLPEKTAQTTAIAALAGLCLLNAFGATAALRDQALSPRISSALAVSLPAGAPAQGARLDAFLKTQATYASPILSNQSQQLYVALRAPTIGVPPRRLVVKRWDAAAMRALACEFGVAWAVVFKQAVHGGEVADDFVLQAVEADPAVFVRVFETEKVVLAAIPAEQACAP